jgi:geranylgeranyl pyrophosphate synthase
VTLTRATPAEQARIQTLLKRPGLSDQAIEEMRGLVARYDGVGYATERATAYAEQGKATLEAFPPCEERETLALIADYVVDRDR